MDSLFSCFSLIMGALFSCFSFVRSLLSRFFNIPPLVSSTHTDLSPSSSTSSPENHDVFISFCGEDVRRGFLSHLQRAFKSKQIRAFMDSDLERGEDIAGSLLRIIEQSDMSIVIFSENYPKSLWCMEELEKIYESMKKRKQIVLPLFYEVDPSDVQHLRGNYAIKMQKWRDSLLDISNLSGVVSRHFGDDAKLVDDVVVEVSMKLRKIYSTLSHEDGLFGIDSSINSIESLLCLDSKNDVRMVGIWGMGGIGKTTIASKLFDRIKNKFSGHYFVSNVKEKLTAREDEIRLRNKIICELLSDEDIELDSPFSVDDSIRKRLKRTKVLVLDDVDTCMKLNSLLLLFYSSNSFCQGSRIVVTSRDSHVLRDVIFKGDIYEVTQLKNVEALQLLSWHAFGQKEPQQGYEEILDEVVRYAQGVPLALVVLGSELKHRDIRYWEAALEKFNEMSPLGIQNILRISYDELDEEQKNIFLDIACFWKGQLKDHVENVLNCFGFHASTGIDRLIEKSLLTEDNAMITMHDLLQQMGHEIVSEERIKTGRKQSRLWKFEDDIKEALTKSWGTENVEAIKLGYLSGDNKIDINPEAFTFMHKLRFLHLEDPHIKCRARLDSLPESLKHLTWVYYPLNQWPSNYNAEKLVQLSLRYSRIRELNWRDEAAVPASQMDGTLEQQHITVPSFLRGRGWNQIKKFVRCFHFQQLGQGCHSPSSESLKSLKLVDLSWSEYLHEITGLEMAPNLETLRLRGCGSLVRINSSLKNLNKLTLLDVRNCSSLCHLPELPCSIKELGLELSGFKTLPSTIGNLTCLKQLSLENCELFKYFPSGISGLSSLEKLSFSKCIGLAKLPESFGNLESLKELDASYSGLITLPQSIQNLKNLAKLDLTGCLKLKFMPTLPPSLEFFSARHCGAGLNEDMSAIVKLYKSKMHDQPRKIHQFCVHGSEVPMWMKYRKSRGTRISLKLNTSGHSIDLIFGVVVSSFRTTWAFSTSSPVAILKSESSETHEAFSYTGAGARDSFQSRKNPPYLFLWNCTIDCKYLKKVSSDKITACGVHPIFNCND